MIWLIGGTGDGVDIAELFQDRGVKFLVTVTTTHGMQVYKQEEMEILRASLDLTEMEELITNRNIKAIIDASHPFAEQVSINSIKAAQLTGIPYLRYERPRLDLKEFSDMEMIFASSYKEAAEKSAAYARIFLTTGSGAIGEFAGVIKNWRERLVVRLLPAGRFVKKAEDLGVKPDNIVALKGPFSQNLNRALYEEYQIDVLVTKASGKEGGLRTKLLAAQKAEIPVIIIRRPELDYPRVFSNKIKLMQHLKAGDLIE